MHLLRVRIGRDIVAEVLPPQRARKKNKVMILASGMPGVPAYKEVARHFSAQGYWVFAPRYKGSWESGGVFLAQSPHYDIQEVIDAVYSGKPFTELWGGMQFTCIPDELVIIGSSFGGPAALLCSKDPRVDKVITVSAVVDWTAPSKAEPLDWLYTFCIQAFGQGYRISKKHWNKLASGTFYNPVYELDGYSGSKILMFHMKDDESVRYRDVEKFASRIKAKLITTKKGGHKGMSMLLEPRYQKHVAQFLSKK